MKPFENEEVDIKGIIHIGGHYGEEYNYYKSLGIDKQIWIEALKSNFDILKTRCPDSICINKAIGDSQGKAMMNLSSNDSESASLLNPKVHLERMPKVRFSGSEEVEIVTLDSLNIDKSYNALVIDVQGYELKVLKGATKTLKHIDYIWTEVNFEEMYEGCAIMDEIDKFLKGFNRKIVYDYGGWGDAFYKKNDKN